MEKQEQNSICREIGARTGGDIYIGVVGPVRSGKSTFIKRFMEQLVLPAMSGSAAARERARDELPQSAAGRTIMTTEPKFIPETAVPLQLEGGGACRVRLIDCVGYMVEGAMGHEEDAKPRMVKSPWFEQEVPFDLAAETGTRKVICEHSTIGVVVTTDGSVSDIPRAGYAEAERRVVTELEALGKPYIILLNSTHPDAPETRQLAEGMARDYRRTVLPVSCVDLDAAMLGEILRRVLYEFPVQELDFALPRWVTMLEPGHWLQAQVYTAAMQLAERVSRMKDLPAGTDAPALECDAVQRSAVAGADLAAGSVRVSLELKPEIFYQVLSEQTGLDIGDEAGLMPCIMELAGQTRLREGAQRLGAGGSHRLRHCDALHRRAASGTAGDRASGRALRGAAASLRALYPDDEGHHPHGTEPHRGHREAERGLGAEPAGRLCGRPGAAVGVQHFRQKSARAGERRLAEQAAPHPAGSPHPPAGNAGAGHQRGLHWTDLYPDLGVSEKIPARRKFCLQRAGIVLSYFSSSVSLLISS